MMDNGASSYRRFLDGDQSGFEEIMDTFHDNLILFLNSYVHNVTVAEDLAMDVFAELIVHKNRFKFNCSLKTYLFSIGRHKAVDYIRKQKRHREIMESGFLPSERQTDMENELIHDDLKRQIHSVLHSIHADYRQVIYLIYFEDMSYEEAAGILKKSRKQIDNLVYRSKKALKTALEKEGFEYAES